MDLSDEIRFLKKSDELAKEETKKLSILVESFKTDGNNEEIRLLRIEISNIFKRIDNTLRYVDLSINHHTRAINILSGHSESNKD